MVDYNTTRLIEGLVKKRQKKIEGEKKGCVETIRSHEKPKPNNIYEARLNVHYPDVSFEYPAKKNAPQPAVVEVVTEEKKLVHIMNDVGDQKELFVRI